MNDSTLPDELVLQINALLHLHKLATADSRTSPIGFVASPGKRQWLLNGSYPIEVSEVLARLATAGANVTPIRAALDEIGKNAASFAANREKFRASAAKKLTKDERKAVGLPE